MSSDPAARARELADAIEQVPRKIRAAEMTRVLRNGMNLMLFSVVLSP